MSSDSWEQKSLSSQALHKIGSELIPKMKEAKRNNCDGVRIKEKHVYFQIKTVNITSYNISVLIKMGQLNSGSLWKSDLIQGMHYQSLAVVESVFCNILCDRGLVI